MGGGEGFGATEGEDGKFHIHLVSVRVCRFAIWILSWKHVLKELIFLY